MHIKLTKICVPTDFSDEADHALKYGLTLAEQFGSELHLLHIVQDIMPTVPEPGLAVMPTEEITRNLEAGAREGLDRMIPEYNSGSVIRVVRHGVPFNEICRYSKDQQIDLIVLGTHGRSGISHFLLGSVAERVVRSAPCPVLTIRHPEHEFVVPD